MVPEEEVRIYLTGDNESFITVKETYAEIKQLLGTVTEVKAS